MSDLQHVSGWFRRAPAKVDEWLQTPPMPAHLLPRRWADCEIKPGRGLHGWSLQPPARWAGADDVLFPDPATQEMCMIHLTCASEARPPAHALLSPLVEWAAVQRS